MPQWLNAIIYPFINGDMLFAGVALGCAGTDARFLVKKRAAIAMSNIAAITGALLVLLSAAPLPLWLYALLFTVFVVCFVLVNIKARRKYWALAILLVVSVLVVALEIPYHLSPTTPYPNSGTVYTVGDSLSMGADRQELNWPEQLGALAGLSVRNHAFGGAKVASAQTNAERIGDDAALIILEIGGNDLLYETPIPEFEASLRTMLETVTRHACPVVLLELPLPPFHNRYGRIQRSLAKEFGVLLVPKYVLARVLTTNGATIDGLHLSHAGHRQLAEELWALRTTPHH